MLDSKTSPLAGCTVFVDVRSNDGKANYTQSVCEQLEILGAATSHGLDEKCTQVVFKNGKQNTLIRAKRLEVPIVNVLWVEKCRETNSHCEESHFFLAEDDPPTTPLMIKKFRSRYKSFQPVSFEESIARSEEKARRRTKKTPKSSKKEALDTTEPFDSSAISRKLTWPPDHSDVCCTQEVAAHQEIEDDMKDYCKNNKEENQNSRQLMNNESFLDCSPSSSQRSQPDRTSAKTDNFVLKPTGNAKGSATPQPESSLQNDSILSSYHPSQHFINLDTSVRSVVSKLEDTNQTDSVPGFYPSSDSEDEIPIKMKCDLTLSQISRMNDNYDFSQEMKDVEAREVLIKKQERDTKRKSKADKKKSIVNDTGSTLKSQPKRKSRASTANSKAPSTRATIDEEKSIQDESSGSQSNNLKETEKNHRRKSSRIRVRSSVNLSSVETSPMPSSKENFDPNNVIAPLEPPDAIITSDDAPPTAPLPDNSHIPEDLPTSLSESETRKRKNRPPRRASNRHRNSSLPEDISLREDGVGKVSTPRRRSGRVNPPSLPPASTTPPQDTEPPSSSRKRKRRRETATSKKTRKSLDDFEISEAAQRTTSQPRKKTQKMKVCTTSCHREDQMLVVSTVRNLESGVAMVTAVTPATTHVIVNQPRRTLNLLRAIIHGCFVVNLDWVTQSVSAGAWVTETPYVISKEYPVLLMSGSERSKKAQKLFKDVGLMFVDKNTTPKQSDLIDLITLCGGQVGQSKARSKILIGGEVPETQPQHPHVTEQWVLDSITELTPKPTHSYIMFPYHSPSPEF